MVRVRCLIVACALITASCDFDSAGGPEEEAPRVIIHGLVVDTVGLIHPAVTVTYQPTADSLCAGPSLINDVSTFTSAYFRKEIEALGSCARIIINAVGQPTIPDTIKRRDLPFRVGAPDSVRIDVVLGRTDLLIVRHRAMLGHSGLPSTVKVAVPDTVVRNQPFTVTSSHYGSGSCTTLDTVEIVYQGNTATLSPYILERRTGPCTLDLHEFTQTAQVTFNAPGPATVTVVGRDTTVMRTTFVR